MSEKFSRPQALLIDIEGVLVRDKSYRPIEGSVAWLNELAARKIPFCLVSNNTTHPPDDLVMTLGELGFPVNRDQLVGALELGLTWLRQRNRRRILWLGSEDLANFLVTEGFEHADGPGAEAVVLGARPGLPTELLHRAVEPILGHGADLVCLHRNPFFLDEKGNRCLGPGAWAAALEALQGPGQVVTVGKPSERIYNEALKRVGVQPHQALFISDDPICDLAAARRLGMQTAFVLSGKYPDHEVLGQLDQEDWPHQVCASAADLWPLID